jgi:hypothetical protein
MLKRRLHLRCQHCKERFRLRRADALFCSDMCKQARHRMNNKKKQEIVTFELKRKRQEEALAAIDQFESYQSLAGMVHETARCAGFNVRCMATKVGILIVEGGSGSFGHFMRPRYRLPPWYREIKTRSDSPEIKALLSQQNPGGPYIAIEAERDFRKVLDQEGGPMNVSVFVENWDQYWAERRADRVSFPTTWADDDYDEPDSISSYGVQIDTSEFLGDGFEIIDPAKQ